MTQQPTQNNRTLKIVNRPQTKTTERFQANDQNQSQPISPTDLNWYKDAKRPISEILADFSKPIPGKYLGTLKDKGNATYIPWYHAVKLLNRVTGGHWDYSIVNIHTTADRIFVVARLTIYAQEGEFFREGTGTEILKREVWSKEKQQIEIKELAYGDPSSNAESMALRRAAAKFGLALYLYDD